MLLSSGEYAEAGKYFADATITSATADADGVVTVNYTVADEAGDPVTGLRGNFTVVKLEPAAGTESFNKWVPYIYRKQEVTAADDQTWPIENNGNVEYQGYRESNGTLTDNGDGSYTYVFKQNLTEASQGPTALAQGDITYDRSLTHRVSVMIGGHSGATADANFDFVPDGSALTETRDIVRTNVCLDCHGEFEFHGHGGDRLTVENCVTCHNPNQIDPHGMESLDMKVMIHKIHAGHDMASIPGPDGIVWNNPATDVDESADNGVYAIWGYRNSKHEWWKAAFPAVIENCTKCHNGDGADVDNWKTVMSRDTCGSCHDLIDWETGSGHAGGANADDNTCDLCHRENGIAQTVEDGHDWSIKDPRNIPEFDVAMSVSTPANGTHFVAGEMPVVTVEMSDPATGMPIDHTTVVGDPDGAQGCLESGCPTWNGLYYHAYLFVAGPRGGRNPVLTTAARVEVMGGAGPFDLSGGGTLDGTVDTGTSVRTSKNGGTVLAGTFSVDVADGTFADASAATAAEVIAWLNGDSAFAARAIAYMDGTNVAVRSRNLGNFFALQLGAGTVNDAIFGGDTANHVVGGYYPSNRLELAANPAQTDPKAVRTLESITYTLDDVADLKPGTYIASVEIAGLGRVNGTNYRTPSVAKVGFQVGQAGEEMAVANNCDSCHQGPDGKGFILDFARHYKIFDETAIDQCGACHDYQNGRDSGAWWGGHPISKRVHAVHYGSELTYPNLTVAYDTHDGRNWDITFPQDILNCETCHPADTSSGSWMTNASRLPCMGCHDTDAASSHMKLQTFDPSPADPWNGDEEESCNTCH
jgi:OmcA/MtrC family decaheme c-type cytochrome